MKKIILLYGLIIIPIISFAQNWQQFAGDSTIFASKFYVDSNTNKLFSVARIINSSGDSVFTPSVWNGNNFVQVGNFDFDQHGSPKAIIVYHDTTYIGGEFNIYNGAPGDYFLRLDSAGSWDTSSISPAYGIVQSFGILNDTLIVMGSFSQIGNLVSHSIAKYSNSQWTPLETGIFGGGYVRSMCNYNDSIIFSGSFGGDYLVPFDGNILTYDNDSIFPFGRGIYFSGNGGVNEGVMCSAVFHGELYIAGDFSADSGRTILKWDGVNWSEVGDAAGIAPFSIRAMQVYHDELYVGGTFVSIGGVYASHIAKWDGIKWCGLGSNINGAVNDITVYNEELIIAGEFNSIDGTPFNSIAKWTGGTYSDTCQSTINVNELQEQQLSIFPTLTTGKITVNSEKLNISSINVYNLLGKLVYTAIMNDKHSQIDLSNLANEVYIVQVEGDGFVMRKKIVKM